MNWSEHPASAPPQSSPWLVRLRTGARGAALYCIPGLGGSPMAFMPLALSLGAVRPVYAVQARGLQPGESPHDSVESMAAFALDQIRPTRAAGPLFLAGWSLGGLVALEAARQLEAAGERVGLVAMFDTWLLTDGSIGENLDDRPVMEWIAPNLRLTVAELRSLPLDRRWETVAETARRIPGEAAAEIGRLAATCLAQWDAVRRHQPRPYGGRVILFAAGKTPDVQERQWRSLCPRFDAETVPGDHYSILRRPHVEVLAERLGRRLDAISEQPAENNVVVVK